MALSYSDWLSFVATTLNAADDDGKAMLTAMAPRMIEEAEARIYQDPSFDWPALGVVDVSKVTTAGLRSVEIPSAISVAGFQGYFVIIETVSLITPAGAKANAGTRVPLLRIDRSFLDQIWPQEGQTQAPAPFETYWALWTQDIGMPSDPSEPTPMPSAILIGPTPDDGYVVEFTGVGRPLPLSGTNSTTFLTTYYPAMFTAATLSFGYAMQRDIGGAANDPEAAAWWEGEYQRLKAVAAAEAARQRSQGPDWSTSAATGPANLPRTRPGGGAPGPIG